jgi:3-hydroxy-5-methyl-1-naphthoate 3-O-methyltransferase
MLDILEQPLARPMSGADRAAELLRGFLASKACFTALDLGIFEALDDRPLSAEALAAQLATHPIATERLCAALCALDLLDVIGDRYTNSALASCYLVERSPDYIGGIATLYSLDTYAACQHLDTAVREGPGWRRRTTQHLSCTTPRAGSAQIQRLTSAVQRGSQRAAATLLDAYDVGAHAGMIEVGGTAELCIAAAQRHPHMRCAFFDLPHICAEAELTIAEAGLARQVTIWPGDMFAHFAIPRAGDLIVLGQVLHQWDDERALMILRNCADALPPGGTLLVREQLLDADRRGPAGPALQNLAMLLLDSGRERSAEEYLDLIAEAGLEPAGVLETAGPFGLVIGRK